MITPLQRWILLDDANIGKNFEKSTYFYKKNQKCGEVFENES